MRAMFVGAPGRRRGRSDAYGLLSPELGPLVGSTYHRQTRNDRLAYAAARRSLHLGSLRIARAAANSSSAQAVHRVIGQKGTAYEYNRPEARAHERQRVA